MKELTLPYITIWCFVMAGVILGILIGGLYIGSQYNKVVVSISEKYMDSIVKVSGMDFETVLESYDYCKLMMNDTEFISNIEYTKRMGNAT